MSESSVHASQIPGKIDWNPSETRSKDPIIIQRANPSNWESEVIMDETFPCPKCGQALTPSPHAVSMQCPACKNFIIIPDSAIPNDTPSFIGATASYADQAVLERLRAGDNIGAIKAYQQSMGASFDEAIAAVDRIALDNQLAKSSDEASKEADAQAEKVKAIVEKLGGGGSPIEALREIEKAGGSAPASSPPLNRAVEGAAAATGATGAGAKKVVVLLVAGMMGLFALCFALLVILIIISPN